MISRTNYYAPGLGEIGYCGRILNNALKKKCLRKLSLKFPWNELDLNSFYLGLLLLAVVRAKLFTVGRRVGRISCFSLKSWTLHWFYYYKCFSCDKRLKAVFGERSILIKVKKIRAWMMLESRTWWSGLHSSPGQRRKLVVRAWNFCWRRGDLWMKKGISDVRDCAKDEENESMSMFVSKFSDATNNVERTKLELIANNNLIIGNNILMRSCTYSLNTFLV